MSWTKSLIFTQRSKVPCSYLLTPKIPAVSTPSDFRAYLTFTVVKIRKRNYQRHNNFWSFIEGNTLSYDPWAAVESLLGGVRLSCGSRDGSQEEEDGAGCQEWADGGARETFRFFLKALAGDTFQRIYESEYR